MMIAVGLVLINRPPDRPAGQGQLLGGIWCSDFMEWSEDYLAGQLDEARRQQMDDHFAQCEHCQQKLQGDAGF